VRNVSHTIRRASEATKLGFTRVIAPENARTLVAAIDLALAR
jgi:predicted ATP-dependent serine protease